MFIFQGRPGIPGRDGPKGEPGPPAQIPTELVIGEKGMCVII